MEPLYSLKVATALIPFPTTNALRSFLTRHRADFPPRYRTGSHRGRLRLLYESECLKIRAMVITQGKSA